MIIMSLYEAPSRKGDKFVCAPKNKLILRLNNVRVMNYIEICDERSILEICLEDQQNAEMMHKYDKATINAMIENNNKWFKNDMTEDNILKRFMPIFDTQSGILRVYVFSGHPPVTILDSRFMDGIKDVHDRLYAKNSIINVEIRLLGMHITRNNFGAKWMLKSLDITTLNDFLVDNDTDIRECWELEIEKIENIIDDRVSMLLHKKKELREMFNNPENRWEEIRRYVNSFLLLINK